MFWKNWPYWLKGGILIELIIIFVISFFIFTKNFFIILYLFLPGQLLVFPLLNKCVNLLAENPDCSVRKFIIPILIISSLLAYFIIGAVSGLIYGKIKSIIKK